MSTQATTTTSVMGSSVDPASLRAAALSTLKKKVKRPVKRIPDVKSTLPRPPPPSSDSFLLDYGQDESSQDVIMSSTIPANSGEVQLVSAKDHVPAVEDVAMREEGEISEEEEPPPPSRAKSTTSTHSPVLPALLGPAAVIRTSPITTRSRSPEFQPTSPVSLIDRIFPAVNKQPKLKQPEDVSVCVEQPSDVAMNFIRPGIVLSQEEYDTVKDIILDLLGWGVPPAAIMDSGVSREVIFYVFSELNLRLPEDFDYSGIPPYTPTMSSEPTQAMEPSTSDHSSVSSFAQHPETHPPVGPTPPTTTTTDDVDFTLLDMEQQRRKELLARKAAVLASRKSKRNSAPTQTPAIGVAEVSTPQPDTPVTPIAPEAVENFLNSIGPSHQNEIIVPLQDIYSVESDAMEVDGQPADNASVHNPKLTPRAIDEPHDLVSIADEPFIEPPASVGPPPWSGDSTATSFSDVSMGSYSAAANSSIRRGNKRPVASDFVDMEPPRYRSESVLDRRLQKVPRFNNLQTMRCVIDISEDDDSGDEQRTPLPSQPSTPMPFEPRMAGTRDRWSKASGQLTQLPAATSILHLKELEIQRMREMIARKEEETRLKKLALASKVSLVRSASGTPAPSAPAQPSKDDDSPSDRASQPPITRLNVGDVDAVASPSSSSDSSNDEPPCIPDQDTSASPSASEPPEEESLAVAPAEEHPECEVSVHSEVDDVDVEQNQSTSAQAISMSPPDLPKPDEKRAAISNYDSQNAQIYSEYRSPFTLYPRLSRRGMDSGFQVPSRDSSQASTVSFFPSTKFSDSSSTTSPSPLKLDLQPLKFHVITRSIDPLKQLCRYEIPGPGVCRDKGCEDIHLSKLESLDPDDNETADYVFRHLPQDWANKHQVKSASAIFQALQAVRQKNSEVVSLDECVDQALRFIGSLSAT